MGVYISIFNESSQYQDYKSRQETNAAPMGGHPSAAQMKHPLEKFCKLKAKSPSCKQGTAIQPGIVPLLWQASPGLQPRPPSSPGYLFPRLPPKLPCAGHAQLIYSLQQPCHAFLHADVAMDGGSLAMLTHRRPILMIHVCDDL